MYRRRRSFRRRRPLRRTRRVYRRRRAFRRSRINATYRTYKFNRTIYGTIYGPNATQGNEAIAARGFEFQMLDLPNYSELVAMFDAYMITGIQIKFFPPNQNVDNALTRGELYYYIDDDDSVPPVDMNEVLQRQDFKVRNLNDTTPFKIYIKNPAVKFDVQNLGGVSPKRRQWIDFANLNIKHYGLKTMWHTQKNINNMLIS